MALSKLNDLSDMNKVTSRFKSILEKKGLEGLKRELNENLDSWQNTKINIAITGSAGAGKSTFINSILGLEDEEDDAAPTGITETTKDCKQYKSKKHPNVIFWDLPGVGTPSFPKDKYVKRVELGRYDFFIIMTRNRFTENDAWLADQIQLLGKQYFFVRSHVGQDIRNYKKAHPNCPDPEKQLSVIRNDCEKELKANTHEEISLISQDTKAVRVYLIDSFELSGFDFNTLVDDLMRIAAAEVKSSVLVSALSSATQEIIDKKFRGLLYRIQYVSFQAGLTCNADTAENVMRKVFAEESKFYREVFEIDDETLKADKELFNLTDLGVEIMTIQLKKINKRLIRSHADRFQECIKQFKKKFKSDLSDAKIGSQNYVKIIFDFLLLYMKCMHLLATCLFQDVPIQVVAKITS